MKKIFFVAILIFFTVGFSFLTKFDSPITIYFGDYEIISSMNFILFALLAVILIIANLVGGYYIIKNADEKKYLQKNKNIQEKYGKCTELITKIILHSLNGDVKLAEKKLKEVGKILGNCNLVRVLESQILLKREKYQAAVDIFRTVEPEENYFIDNVRLTQSLKSKNQSDIEFFCKKILKYRENDRWAMANLYKVYREDLNWLKCTDLLGAIKKYKVFPKEDIRIEKKIIESNLSVKLDPSRRSLLQKFTGIFKILGGKCVGAMTHLKIFK